MHMHQQQSTRGRNKADFNVVHFEYHKVNTNHEMILKRYGLSIGRANYSSFVCFYLNFERISITIEF